MNDIIYRKAVLDDLTALVELRIEFLKEVRGLSDEEKAVLRVTNRDYILNGLLDSSLVIFIAEDDNKIVATSGIMFYRLMPGGTSQDGRRAYIANMYTLPGYRNKGIATNLMKLQIEEAKKRGLTSIFLSATEAGRPVYENLGFTDIKDNMILKL